MRKLMWFSIGFALASAIGAYCLHGAALLLPLALACVGIGVCAALKSKIVYWKKGIAVLLGCAVGIVWFFGYELLYLEAAREADEITTELSICVSDHSYETDYGVAADGTVQLDGKTYRVRFYVNEHGPLLPGDTVWGEFRLRTTLGNDKNSGTYHRGEGTFLLAYPVDAVRVIRGTEDAAMYFAANLRQSILSAIDSVFPADTVGFARALLLGDDSMLSYEEDTAFKVSGIRHVIAVSGLHVSILFAMVYTFAGKRRVLTAALGLPVLVLFAAVAGFTPSIVRASIMQGLMILALLFNKEYDPPTALGFSVLTMLAVNPMAITSVSLQLSALCMVGIFLFSGKIREYLLQEKRLGTGKGRSLKERLARWLAGSVSISLGAMVLTLPLSALYFGTVSVLCVVTNLLALWAVSFVFYGIMLACVLGAFSVAAGQAVAWLISWLMRYIQQVAGAVASIPFSAVYTCSGYIVLWLVFAYILLSLFLISRKKRPVLFSGCLLLSLCLAIAASCIEPRLDNYRLTALDVGQGQSILLQGQGKNYLVDCGGDSSAGAADAAAQLLLSQGVDRLDGLILTHFDKDHVGGVEYLLTRISADALYVPVCDPDTQLDEQILERFSGETVLVEETTVLEQGGVKVTLFAGEPGVVGNESSLCILFQTEKCDILITGDRSIVGEQALLEQTQLPTLDALVVGHHGAGTSASLELLRTTKPAVAIISVGKDNRYGHPDNTVLKRLEMFRCRILRTDTDGTIMIRG